MKKFSITPNTTFAELKDMMEKGKILVGEKEENIEEENIEEENIEEKRESRLINELPYPALQDVLLKLHRSDLHKVCSMSRKAKKICDLPVFRERYNRLHPILTDKEINENLGNWIREMYGDTNIENVVGLDYIDFLNILEMIENKTADNKKKIIFYGEEIFSSKFVEEAGELKAGFVANSLIGGILGSFIVEILKQPRRLDDHVDLFQDLQDGEESYNIENFIRYIIDQYENYSKAFDLNDTFTSEIQNRIVDNRGLRYESRTVTATLPDVDVWDVKRLENEIE